MPSVKYLKYIVEKKMMVAILTSESYYNIFNHGKKNV